MLVTPATGDDAAVYLLPDGRALVQTVDFFTTIVDDPYDWGRIAAANALSDVYAMGGTPVLALNLVAWPVGELSLDLLSKVLQGGADVATGDRPRASGRACRRGVPAVPQPPAGPVGCVRLSLVARGRMLCRCPRRCARRCGSPGSATARAERASSPRATWPRSWAA